MINQAASKAVVEKANGAFSCSFPIDTCSSDNRQQESHLGRISPLSDSVRHSATKAYISRLQANHTFRPILSLPPYVPHNWESVRFHRLDVFFNPLDL